MRILISFELHVQTLDLTAAAPPLPLRMLLLLPHVCHILATCATGIATPAPPSPYSPPAASLHYPGQHFVCMPNYIAHLIEVC